MITQYIKKGLAIDENVLGTNGFLYNNEGQIDVRNPDLSGHVPYTGATADVALGVQNITAANLAISNWNTAYGWGNHASAGYLTSVTAHNLLSTTHGDTLADSVASGDLLYGNATPKWARLAKGTDGKFLKLVSGLPSWESIPAGVSFGTTTQIPYMNAGGTDFLYSAGLTFNGSLLDILSTSNQLRLTYSSGIYTSFVTTAGGNLTISPSGGRVGFGNTANSAFQVDFYNGSSDTVILNNSNFFFEDSNLGAGLLGQQKRSSPYSFVLQVQNRSNNSHFPISLNPLGGDIYLPRDNEKLLFGTGLDASIYYDGTNLIINPKEVGTGIVSILGGLKTAGGRITGITTVTDTYNILTTDETIVCNKATAFTVTLPAGVVGQIFHIKNINTGVVTVSLAGDTIDGETSQTLNQWDSMKIQCRLANTWIII